MCTSVVARGDAAPVFELGERVLDLVALAIQGFVIVEWMLCGFWLTGCTARCPDRPEHCGTSCCRNRDRRASGGLWQAGQ